MAAGRTRDATAADDRRAPRDQLAAARQQFVADIERGLGGRAAHARFSERIDDLIRGLADTAPGAAKVSMAVAALGGYGRRALCLHSDIDLLIVFEHAIGAAEERCLKGLLHPLWDLGLTVGHQVRTLAEALTIDVDDPEFLLAQVDARFLAGRPALLERIDRRAPGLAGEARDLVIEALLRLTTERYGAYNDTIYQLEPDVKESPGGLRDLVAARLLASLAHDPAAIDEDALEQAENFLLRVRSLLHLETRRNGNVLSHELQERVAERLRFPGGNEKQRVEALMSRYFAHARTVARALETAIERTTPGSRALPVSVGRNIQIAAERVTFLDPERAAGDPPSWLDAFALALEHGVPVSADALALIERRGSRYRGSDVLHGPEARRRFLKLLVPRPGLYATLGAMHDCGLLGRLVDGFDRIQGRVIRDFYHRYTVDEHTLLTVRGLERLATAAGPRARFAGLLAEIAAPEYLTLALLLHDLGKWKEHDHAQESLRMAQRVLDDLDVEGEARQDVEFLIGRHLELSAVAFRRDTTDPQVIARLADIVGTEARLKLLCVLTLVDIDAVGPGILTPWKEEILWDAFVRTYNHLTHAYADHTIAAADAAVTALVASAPRDLDAAAVAAFLEGFPRRYLSSVAPDRIHAHARLATAADGGDVRVRLDARDGVWELAVVTTDRPRLFASICGTLACHGMDILRGSAMTSTRGQVLDVFEFADRGHFLARNGDGVRLFSEALRQVIAGKEDVARRLARKETGASHRRAPLRVAPIVHVDNDSSPTYTIVEIVAQDAPGLLYRIGRVVSQHGCDVDLVLISTEGNRAIDVFHVTHAGAKLARPLTAALRADLERVLQEGA
jgi:[protein-PII] uridylyltransferase